MKINWNPKENMHEFIRSPDLLFIFQLVSSLVYVDTVFLDEIWTKLCPSILIESAIESNRYGFYIRSALSQPSLTVLAPHCELHRYFIRNTFSQDQLLAFTNIDKANVTSVTTVRYVQLILRSLTLPITHKICWSQPQAGVLSLRKLTLTVSFRNKTFMYP